MTQDGTGAVEIREVETLAENWHPLRQYSLDLRRRDGQVQRLKREVYHNGTAAAVLPHDPERGTVLLIRQFRLPPHLNGDAAFLVEACAGMVEDGDTPAETVRKEAGQELGYRLHEVRKVLEVYASPGSCTEKLHLFLAEYRPADRQGAGGGLAAEGEDIAILELPLAEAWAMVGRGEIIDSKTVLLLQHLRLRQAKLA